MSTIKLKRSAVGGRIPSTSDLALGELAINTYDGKAYIKKDVSGTESIVQIGAANAFTDSITVNSFTGNGSNTQYTVSVEPPEEQFAFVFLNGVLQHTSEYSISNLTLTFSAAPFDDDIIEVRTIGGLSPHSRETYVYTASTDTTFSGTDNNGSTLSYSVGLVEVYVDGVKKVESTDYTATNGTSIVLTTAVSGTVEIVSLSALTLANQGVVLSPLTATTANQVVDTIVASTYRSVKYIVQMTQGTNYHVTEVLIIHDGTNTYMTEYGTMFTNTSLGTISSDVSGGNLRLLVTPVSTNTTINAHKITVAV